MDLHEAIHARRSIRQFTNRPVSREEIEVLLEAAVHAPNHRLTQPWRFYVLGPEAKLAYARVLAGRKARKVDDPAAAKAIIEKVVSAGKALPAQLAVSQVLADSPEVTEEDFAATMMAVQNILLTAHSLGLGTHLRTGAIMADPQARLAVGVPDNERIVATIELGEPASAPPPKARRAAHELTVWVP